MVLCMRCILLILMIDAESIDRRILDYVIHTYVSRIPDDQSLHLIG